MFRFKKVEKFLDRLLIHEKLHENFEDLGKARFVVYALVFSSLFVSIYTVSLELSGKELPLIKTVANYLGVLLGIGSIIAVRKYGSIGMAVLLNLLLGAVFVIVSAYFSGGLLSVDMFWFIVLTMISFLFVGSRAGFFMTLSVIGIISAFFLAASLGFRDYWAENQASGLLYEYLNMLFLLLFAALLVYFYVSGTSRIKQELAELKEKQLQYLGDQYKYITDHATDIIAIFREDGQTNYISPAVEHTLGYAPAELKGRAYADLLQFASSDKKRTVSCLHKNGERVYLEVDYSTVREEIQGQTVIISIARNITDKVIEDQKVSLLRAQLANDFHDEMGNKLAAITLNSNLLSLQLDEHHQGKSTLATIEQTSKSLYQNSRDFIWSIDARSDRLDEIFFYLKDFAEDLFQNFPITFRAEVPAASTLSRFTLEMYTGRHLVLIFKEAITNVLKHSQASNIFLRLRLEKDSFQMEVEDDGVGYSSLSKHGKGLKSMEKRSARIGCALKVTTNHEGTKVQVQGKLPN